ncbi:error-prone DNA polymerase [Hyphococcus sp.]|uniref:error-prone DNA polymerase n=1 Tax=Hyphococcus sp. TaxID=2038636 RepID=UPI002086D2D9|nr:MAG: error-prone DNA polymerase [Marinicaulis sp.]
MTAYAELAAMSNFTFLKGASHPDELVFQAAKLGLDAIAVTDVNTLAGVVRAHTAAKEIGFRFITGARLKFVDDTPDILCWPSDRAAYGRLCKLLTRGKMRAAKGDCEITRADVLELGEGQLFAVLPDDPFAHAIAESLNDFRVAFPGSVWLAGARAFRDDDRRILNQLALTARGVRVPLLAVNDILYHAPERRRLADVVHCIREHCTVFEAGRALEANAERHLKPPTEMLRLFKDHPAAIEETLHVAARARFSLDELRYEYPEENCGASATPQEELQRLSWEGAKTRYPDGVPEKVAAALNHELALIEQLDYARYFLTVYDIVRYARSQGILCQGRGSAANSSVCYCLGVTSVDPARIDLLFERFVSADRNEPPDIDVDFEHERREEVLQYIYRKYGRDRAGIAATVITYRTRSAVREVGKAFGLSEDVISSLAKSNWGSDASGVNETRVKEQGLNPADLTLRHALHFSKELIGFPRHLSQHTGGFVMTRGPLEEVIPIGNAAMPERSFVEWDKDDLDALGMIKVDVLGLGMLTCIANAFALLKKHYGVDLDLASIPAEERQVYDMICKADTLGVFQIESRAQMSMLPRLKPRNFYDLVIEVAIVRPGPIQGDMVHPYLRRRDGLEKVEYPSKDLENVLGRTLGVPLFQEQAMKIAIVAAGFTPTQADGLRRAMATFRRAGTIHQYHDKMVEGMAARGYDRDFAERCFKQIEGFGEYGFPESHAASFALLVYVSCWLKCRYPDVFAAALVNAQPMGFYAPAQIVRDAREHGVGVKPVDINHSYSDLTLEPSDGFGNIHARHRAMGNSMRASHAIRLGFRLVKGLADKDAERIEECRGAGYDSVRDLWLRTGLSQASLEILANADAFGSLGLSRRDALWAVQGLDKVKGDDQMPLFAAERAFRKEEEVRLPTMPLGEEVAYDYKTVKMSLKRHPVSFLRGWLKSSHYAANEDLWNLNHSRLVSVSGLVLVRQRPGTAKGVIFATLEDETGIANIIIWPKIFERFRREVLGARFLGVSGVLQREGDVIHIVARRLYNLTPKLSDLSGYHGEMDDGLSRADEFKRPVNEDLRKGDFRRRMERAKHMEKILPGGRNFH